MLFTGRLTANAAVATVKGDRKVTNFTVALNQRFKTKTGEKREKTAFVDCAYWVNPGLADYLTKGAVVEISGWVEAETWTDNKDKVHARLRCNVDTVKLFSVTTSSGADTTQTATAEAAKDRSTFMLDGYAATEHSNSEEDKDDLPF